MAGAYPDKSKKPESKGSKTAQKGEKLAKTPGKLRPSHKSEDKRRFG